MSDDLRKMLMYLLLGLLVGSLFSVPFLGLLAGTWAYLFYFARRLNQLSLWLKNRAGSEEPAHEGLIGEITKEFNHTRRHYKLRGEKLTGYLNRFQDATNALPDAIVILGEHGRIDWANKKARQYLDIRWPQDSGQRISNLIRKPEMSDFIHFMDEGILDQTLELELGSPQAVRLEFRIAPYEDTQKLMVARDITKLHQNNQMRKDFIANASHELRTPLTVVSGYLESFQDDEDCPAGWNSIIRTMRKQATRMQSLITDLLELSALESSRDEHDYQDEIHVSEMISSIHQEAASVSGVMAHVFYIEVDSSLRVMGNQRQLYSAFSNLVINAVQYTPEQGIIRIKWFLSEDEACLQVSDTGEGIPEADIPRLTERFYRVDKGRSRERGGTGLGLAIVKHVLAAHGGRLVIESTLGKGSTFSCHFPADRVLLKEPSDKVGLLA